MSQEENYRWRGGSLQKSDPSDPPVGQIAVADSWLVADGAVLAIALHRDRFVGAVRDVTGDTFPAGSTDDASDFFDAAVALLPRTGAYFPRIELLASGGAPEFLLRLRPAPELTRSVVVASIPDGDPRSQPGVKGPDLERMGRARSRAAGAGAGEAVVLTDDGLVVEGAYSALLWWRGKILCGPPAEFDRVDSVTARSVLALAAALGVETYEEAVTPAELEGTELWSLSALHGIRIVTGWVDGPALAELPGRLTTWRTRLGALRQPL